MASRLRISVLVGLASLFAITATGSVQPCDWFAASLEAVPHVGLSERIGPFESLWDGETYEGCEVEFETHDSLSAEASVASRA